MNSRKKIIITGASGFLGSHLVEKMKDDERYEVYAFSSKPDALKEKLGGENIEYFHKDILDGEMLKDGIVINCAYPRNSAGAAIADGLRYTQNVFECAARFNAEAIINISSQSVYSQQRIEVATEETPVCLESLYAVGKYAVELMLESICKGREIKHTSLRMASLIGPGFDQRIINRLIKKLIFNEPITIIQQPKQMGFLDVEDAVRAIIAVIASLKKGWKPIYNVGNGHGYTVEEIYNLIEMELKDSVKTEKVVFQVGEDISNSAVSYDLLRKDTGFIPTVDLEESINRIIAYI